MKLRKNRPLLLIDIAVPRDIEPEVNLLRTSISTTSTICKPSPTII